MTDDINLTYLDVTHAPLIERFMSRENGHEKIGEPERAGMDAPRIDPETGVEYRATGGRDHKYSRDYKVGPSYNQNVFIKGHLEGSEESLTHDELEAALKERNLWSEYLEPVLLPKGHPTDDNPWWSAFIYRPVDMKPSLDRIERQLKRKAETEDFVTHRGHVVEGLI